MSRIGANSAASLVSVRLEAAVDARSVNLVVGVTIAGADLQEIDEIVLHDRHLHFGEQLAHVEPAIHRRRRTALAGKIATGELVINLEVEALLAILGAHVEADTVFRPGSLDAVFAALEGEVDVTDPLVDHAALEARSLEEGKRILSHATRREDIPRNASGVGGPVEEAAADRRSNRYGGKTADRRVGDDVQCLSHTANGKSFL